MIEKIRAIQNPLTIIAIFAALAEVAGTVALATVDVSIQSTFIWFVMGFPTGLVLLFFITLNFNPKVLYAPSDFKDEENFLRIIAGSKRLTTSLDAAEKQVEEVQVRLASQLEKDMGQRGAEVARLRESLSKQLDVLRLQLDEARRSATEFTTEITSDALPHSSLQARILAYLSAEKKVLTSPEIGAEFGMSPNATTRALERLEKRGLIKRCGEGNAGWAISE